jgi:hypothetical protein
MNRTPIASPLLLVGRDATETWHGSDDEYREVGLWQVISALSIDHGRITGYHGSSQLWDCLGLSRKAIWCTLGSQDSANGVLLSN